ncbi:MAG: YdiU family protein [Rhodobacteraceae bacterium]|nr:YdiU family protein [Paracoccaceae bacterium]
MADTANPFKFDNSYARLPSRFFARVEPVPVSQPGLIAVNRDLARELCLDPDWLASGQGIETLAGNRIPRGAESLAMAYAGHQFGQWVPQLGDGRAHLIGEVRDTNGDLRDIQLKGSGPTPFSRRGDGRAWLGPVLREYIVSEAMHALGIPSTRALAAVTTGEAVFRETALPGAILTRVARGHVRIGTFQYFYARNDHEGLELLLKHVMDRHYPEAGKSGNPALAVLNSVVCGQAELIAKWLGVGFIHGVMNTDNMSVACETVDFGPCAFMDEYAETKVFSSIDQGGRYAFARQPDIALWNLAQLATSLLPLIDGDSTKAATLATDSINQFPDRFSGCFDRVMAKKIGLGELRSGDGEIIHELLKLLELHRIDFTHAFRALTSDSGKQDGESGFAQLFAHPSDAAEWMRKWKARLGQEGSGEDRQRALMRAVNPAIIPRNHQIEIAIEEACNGEFLRFHRLNAALQRPFEERPEFSEFAAAPFPHEVVTQTFCGT